MDILWVSQYLLQRWLRVWRQIFLVKGFRVTKWTEDLTGSLRRGVEIQQTEEVL